MKAPPRKKLYHLAGEGQVNVDGSSRQEILRSCSPGMSVELVRERENPHDPNAIAASVGGRYIGYVARDDAVTLSQHFDGGRKFKAQIHELRGGLPDFPHLGCIVCIVDETLPFLSPRPMDPEQVLYDCVSPRLEPARSEKPAARPSGVGGFLRGLMKAMTK